MSEHEGFCIPVIEAEYCGLPVLAHYRRGVPEALGPTQPWLTSLKYDDYAHILRRIRMEPAYARTLGEAGAASVRERFDISAIRKRFLEWVEDVVAAYEPSALTPTKNLDAPHRPKLAFVVQRFGRNVSGGAEAYARICAEHLSSIYDITILTTTSKTLDWDNELMLERDEEPATFKILRFPPIRQRDTKTFLRALEQYQAGEISYDQYQDAHGPDVPAMAGFLTAYGPEFDLVINWTYLYKTTSYTSSLEGRVKIINVPCFHDEIFIRLDGIKKNSLSYDANIYQTYAEKNLAESIIGDIDKRDSLVLGAGIDEGTFDAINHKHTASPLNDPYIIYVGRIEKVKNINKLIDMFKKFKGEYGSALKLVIIGRNFDYTISKDDDIILPGFISEEDKVLYMKHALCLVNPSYLESFSLVLIESWALSRPVLVAKQCAATSSQVERSGGGITYQNYREFAQALSILESDKDIGNKLGINGLEYYENNYRWNILVPKMKSFFQSIMNK
jgi:glycosyltransferase involved in cell wall biosynthesis